MSKELQLKLANGDQIIATEIAFYDHAPGKQSQHVGDLLMVNNTHVRHNLETGQVRTSDHVSGCLLNNLPGESRNRVGLCSSLDVGTFRRATPDDAGFMATREQWCSIADAEIRSLRRSSFAWGVIAILSLGVLAYVVMP